MSRLLLGVGGSGGVATTVLDNYAGKYTSLYNSGLLAYWRMNETAGTSAGALPSTGYQGTYSGVTLNSTTAPGGGAAPGFDGVNDWVALNTTYVDDNFPFSSGTLSLWVQTPVADLKNAIAFYADANNYYQLTIGTTQSGRIGANRVVGGTVNQVLKTGLGDFTTWTHVVVTWDESDDLLKLFVNGSSVGSTADTQTWGVSSMSSNYMGVTWALSADWTGNLSHVALWDRVLPNSEITDLASTVL